MEQREPEVWKPIPGYEGWYEISSWGNVRSLDRYVNHCSGVKLLRKAKNRKLNLRWHYYKILLSKDDKHKVFNVHELVLLVYHGLKREKGQVINHIDLDKLNNYYKNLELVNIRENTSHYYKSTKKESKFISVTLDRDRHVKKWAARIWLNGKNKTIGRFETEEEAHQAYLDALKKYGLKNKYATESS